MENNPYQQAFACESHVRRIISDQQTAGVKFNAQRARFYVHVLRDKKAGLFSKVRPYLRLEVLRPYDGPVNKPYLKDGSLSDNAKKWYGVEDTIPDIGGPFSRVEFVEPDLGSRVKLIAQLLRLGWKPIHFTPVTKKGGGGNPKLTFEGEPCESLDRIGSEVGQAIADWYIYNHRESQIRGWLRRLRPDGRLSAEATTIGTPTYRFTHKIVVNVPKAKKYVKFGWQMRSLFTVEDGYWMVGHDASGLELRMLAHYLNDPDYTAIVVEGKEAEGTDIHTKNQHDAGLPNRDDAKTFIYAFIYGAGNLKIGLIIGGSEKDGAKIKRKFLKANPRLAKLIKTAKAAAERGYLIGLDGRKIWMRRDKETKQVQTHKALNTLLQSSGAIVMKYSMIYLDKWARKEMLQYEKVIDMHDEGQAEVLKKDAHKYGELAVRSIQQAGRFLKLNVPLDAEYKIGLNWAQTH